VIFEFIFSGICEENIFYFHMTSSLILLLLMQFSMHYLFVLRDGTIHNQDTYWIYETRFLAFCVLLPSIFSWRERKGAPLLGGEWSHLLDTLSRRARILTLPQSPSAKGQCLEGKERRNLLGGIGRALC
jgi:hypothetical protein